VSALAMQEIAVEDAVGQILCHDITEIVRGVRKGARFRKGHVVEAADIPVLLSLGKEHLYVWENDGTLLHENEAAEILRGFCQNEGMEASEPKEGKIELRALHDGVFAVDVERFHRLNDFDDIMVACAPQYMAVKKGDLLAGMRVIPLAVKKDLMEEAARSVGEEPIFRLLPYRSLKVGVVTTGSEVAHGRIKDTFTPVLAAKLRGFGLSVNEHRISDDALEHTQAAIEELLDRGMDMVLCTGGMSVDPDDRTPAAQSSRPIVRIEIGKILHDFYRRRLLEALEHVIEAVLVHHVRAAPRMRSNRLPPMTVVGFEYLPEDPPRPYECGAQHYVKSRQPHGRLFWVCPGSFPGGDMMMAHPRGA